MDVGEIRDNRTLQAWLEDKPSDWAHVVIFRTAMRVFPFSARAPKEWLVEHSLVAFRSLAISWSASNFTESDWKFAVRTAASAALVPDTYELSINEAANAFDAVSGSSHFTNLFLHFDSHSSLKDIYLAQAATVAMYAAGAVYIDEFDIWLSIVDDCRWLIKHPKDQSPARAMTRRGLLLGQQPKGWRREWNGLKGQLLTIDPNYAVWIDWYERRIRGERAAFDIPGDRARVEDKKILRRLAEATDEDFWGKGHEYVNATLKSWLDEARERVNPHVPKLSAEALDVLALFALPKQTSYSITAALEAQASPQAQIVDGQLDAVPNANFDKPQYSDNLADLPSELMAYTSTIISALPNNCPNIVRICFTGFRDELLVRGNRPILNILKGMAASIQAELYESPDEDASPGDLQLRDPREWGPGMGAMFAHFFESYFDLLHHFPLDEEREELIANTPIDEVAASGSALTEPINAVADEIAKLGELGGVTDNFVRIMEALRLYNRDLAQLPPPSNPNGKVTPKWRHVLMIAGFFLNLYNFVGSTASIYSIGAEGMQGLLMVLKAAVEKLLSFIV